MENSTFSICQTSTLGIQHDSENVYIKINLRGKRGQCFGFDNVREQSVCVDTCGL